MRWLGIPVGVRARVREGWPVGELEVVGGPWSREDAPGRASGVRVGGGGRVLGERADGCGGRARAAGQEGGCRECVWGRTVIPRG